MFSKKKPKETKERELPSFGLAISLLKNIIYRYRLGNEQYMHVHIDNTFNSIMKYPTYSELYVNQSVTGNLSSFTLVC